MLSRLSPQPLALWQVVNLQEIQSRGRKVVRYAVYNLSSFLSWETRGEQSFLLTISAYDLSPVAMSPLPSS